MDRLEARYAFALGIVASPDVVACVAGCNESILQKLLVYRKFEYLTMVLQQLPVEKLTEAEMLVFWPNIFHLLQLHATIRFRSAVLKGSPPPTKAGYIIQGDRVYLPEVEQFCFYGWHPSLPACRSVS
jgi:hypothetical protein